MLETPAPDAEVLVEVLERQTAAERARSLESQAPQSQLQALEVQQQALVQPLALKLPPSLPVGVPCRYRWRANPCCSVVRVTARRRVSRHTVLSPTESPGST